MKISISFGQAGMRCSIDDKIIDYNMTKECVMEHIEKRIDEGIVAECKRLIDEYTSKIASSREQIDVQTHIISFAQEKITQLKDEIARIERERTTKTTSTETNT